MALISVLYLWVQNKIVEMEKLKRAYCYLFYKLYKMSEAAPSRWLSHWKASLAIMVLEIWLIAAILIYYKLFLNGDADIIGSNLIWVVMVLGIGLIDYYIFHNHDQWKNYIKEFDQLPKETSRRWGMWLWIIVALIIANFIFSFYLYYQI